MRAFLISMLLTLCGVVALQWHDWPPEIETAPRDSETSETESPSTNTTASPMELLDPPLEKEDYASVIERPLFLPDRRPPAETPEQPEVVEEETASTELETMDLNAVIITPSEAIAWVKTPSQPTAEKLRIGDELEGWTVKAIQGDEVKLERQGKIDTLVLRDYTRSPQPVARPPRRAARRPASRSQRPRQTTPTDLRDTPPRSRNNAQRPSRSQ